MTTVALLVCAWSEWPVTRKATASSAPRSVRSIVMPERYHSTRASSTLIDRTLPNDHPCKDILLQQHEHPDQHRQPDRVPEHEPQNLPLAPHVLRRRARDDDALRIDHLPHDTARAVRRRHEHGAEPELLRRDPLQAAE